MINDSAPFLRDLILTSKDGDWGKGEAVAGHVPYRIIRGTDFPDVRLGEVEAVPTRYLEERTVARRRLLPNDILIETAGGSHVRPTGRTLLVKQRILDAFDLPVTCASFARFLRIDPSKGEPAYVFWYLQHLYEEGEMWQHQVQHTGVARFQYTRFAETTRIPLPSLPEQRRIARILGALDDKIELNRRMNRTLEAMAQALFKSWFVDFDPVVAKAAARESGTSSDAALARLGLTPEQAALFPDRFVETDNGPVPEGWGWSSIAEIASYVNGRNFTKNATGNGRMVIRIAELNSGPSGSTVYNVVEAAPENTAFPGDLLFSWSGSLDVYRWHGAEALINQHIFKVIPRDVPQWFVYYQLCEAMPLFQAIAADKATTMGHIKREHLGQAALVMPPREVLASADALIRPLYEQIGVNEVELQHLARVRDTMLPELLAGERTEQFAGAANDRLQL